MNIEKENELFGNINPIPNYFYNQNTNIKNIFGFPPKIGLKNLGLTSYMNSALQYLSHIEPLTNYFKYDPYIEEVINDYRKKNEDCLTESYKIVIENLWPSNSKYQQNKYCNKNTYEPYDFKKKISSMNDLFKGVHANDAKDLFLFIIETLHHELNKKKDNYISKSNEDPKNETKMLNDFVEYFSKGNKSIISDLFYGVNHTITKCSGCNISNHNYECYFYLNFPLEEVRKFKLNELQKINNNMMMNQNDINQKIQLLNNNIIDIKDCFEYNQKEEYFLGDNGMYCNNCNKQLDATYQTVLYSLPQILVIILNRGTGNNFKVKVEFSEFLDLSPFAKIGGAYKLISAITHLGESDASGHFIATCKSPIDNRWYCYIDDRVSVANDFKSENLDKSKPYILFYKRQ